MGSLVMAAAMIVLELKSADLTEKQVQHMTGIPVSRFLILSS